MERPVFQVAEAGRSGWHPPARENLSLGSMFRELEFSRVVGGSAEFFAERVVATCPWQANGLTGSTNTLREPISKAESNCRSGLRVAGDEGTNGLGVRHLGSGRLCWRPGRASPRS